MSASQPHFRLFGIPVRVELMFFLLPLISLTSRDVPAAMVWTALVFTGVLAHELGHALAMKHYGFAPAITLHGLGGLTHFPVGAQPTPKQHFFITLAGPSVGLTLGVIALGLQVFVRDPPPLVTTAIGDALWINLGWSIINLLPVLPWDGGLILDSGLEWFTGKRRHFVVGASSLLGGAAILIAAVKFQAILLGYFGLMGALHGFNRLRMADGDGTLNPGFGGGGGQQQPAAGKGTWWERLHAGEDLEEELRFQMRTSADPATRAQFAELLAWACLRKRDFPGARQAVQQMGAVPPSLSLRARLAAASNDPDQVIELLWSAVPTENDLPLLVSALIMRERFDDVVRLALKHPALADTASTRLFEAQAFEQSLELCRAERERTGIGRFAYNEACCLCRLGRFDDAVTALQKAKPLGCPELKNVATDADLAPIRDRPEVLALIS